MRALSPECGMANEFRFKDYPNEMKFKPVPEEAIVIVVGSRPGRDDGDGQPTRLEDAEDLAQRPAIVGHVLEQVGADNRVDRGIAEW